MLLTSVQALVPFFSACPDQPSFSGMGFGQPGQRRAIVGQVKDLHVVMIFEIYKLVCFTAFDKTWKNLKNLGLNLMPCPALPCPALP
jgi:hypothetical protein